VIYELDFSKHKSHDLGFTTEVSIDKDLKYLACVNFFDFNNGDEEVCRREKKGNLY